MLYHIDCFSGNCHPDTGRRKNQNQGAETERSRGAIKRHEAEEAKAEKDKKDKEQKEKDKWATSCFCTSCHQILYCFVFYIKSLETAGRVVICILVTEEIWNRCNASLHGEINCANKELTLNFSRKIGWTEYYT